MVSDRKKKNLEEIVYGGKLQPQATDLEVAVLGAMMLEKNAPQKVMAILSPDTFYMDSHKLIFKAISSLYYSKSPVDIMTVSNQLKNTGNLEQAGGRHYVVSLTNRVASAGNLEFHSHILIEKRLKRDLIQIGSEMAQDCFNDEIDPFKVKGDLESKLLKLNRELNGTKEKDWNKAVDNAVSQIKAAMQNPEHVSGIPTGHPILDAITGGWQNTDLVILAGRPGMGKTARALALLKAALKHGVKCKFYSFEMSIEQLIRRMIAEESGVDLQDLNRGRVSDNSFIDIEIIASSLKNLPIKVNDDGRMNILDLASECRMLSQTDGLGLIIIDYLQITKGPKDNKMNRNDLIGFITAECKNIAKECNCPVISLAQVGRKGEAGADKRPTLENLRESGSIEQDADVVIFIYRPAYYTNGDQSKEKEEFLKDIPNDEYLQYTELIIAKHRNGKIATIKEYFDGSTQKFKPFFKSEDNQPAYVSQNFYEVEKPELPF